jgi:type VI secretion system secreted protein VgrG
MRKDTVTVTLESQAFSCDELTVNSFTAIESISRLYEVDIEVICKRPTTVDAAAMLGADLRLAVHVDSPENPVARSFHGTVVEVDDLLSTHADFRAFRLRLEPVATSLKLVTMHEIFIHRSVPEIIVQKLGAVDLGDAVDVRLDAQYPKREFVVQYGESDLSFLSRLSEHLGISFCVEEKGGTERIVFTDHNEGFSTLDEPIDYRSKGEARGVFELESKRRTVPSYYIARDYNYRTPLLDLTGEHDLKLGYGGGVVEFGGHHKTPAEGATLARVRAEERACSGLVYAGSTTVVALAAGRRFTVRDHPDLGTVELLLTHVEHTAAGLASLGSLAGADESFYKNRFHAIPAATPYRPPRVTPRPRIYGLATGVIEGPEGSGEGKYAFIDDQGRYLVRFVFEVPPQDTRVPSHPVRMAQNHVGEGYGTHFPLKPGAEVVVGFIDGDPDRPIIVGAVPNPIKPSAVTAAEPGLHRIKTSTGIVVDMKE